MIYNLPRAKKKGETWYLNEEPTNGQIDYSVNFISNSKSFIRIYGYSSVKFGYAIEYTASNDTVYVYNADLSDKWESGEAYRTITLAEPATGDLLTWLQANAVKQ